ncbi:MAG: alpha-ketoacid dehydrogenase subunit beta [Phycisphaerae bacterium]|nr:alpha-ketoacid dehydrogenase subunit beta [Phycisphaerae bacterium]MBT5382119.1 alpha-ketoacid dehydrogenase subunit beta [Phycisphaerae bacterium]MBT5583925.1 alpha-ketoacid dehydrogenase subunit beta [Phycisphaerae bacterium]MBT5658184.1 alpha-ketoacid dehydrogenase subunit beta [Phycisphaerae bacterium]MBT7351324.1 alpha-ketoacid dehydrogenase subunit beta [Phycisphaerae bacterium]
MADRTMVEALNLALDEALESDSSVCLMGQDIGVNGGVFRVTRGLQERHGADRVMDTPLVECGIIGTAVGMAVYGMKPVAEIQFSGFTMQAFDQIEQNMARIRGRTQGRFPIRMVLRTPYGGGIRAVEHHSESREAYWAHTPGLKVVIPSGPRNARALLAASIQDPDPVVFYEPKALYRAFREDVPDTPETMELGRANIVQEGNDITIISYGAMMRPAIEAVEDLAQQHGVQAELIDLLTISPMDTQTLTESVAKTGRCIIVHEGHQTCGIGAEIAARITECDAFQYMLAPIRRLTAPDLPFPYFQVEQHFLPDPDDIIAAANELMDWS